MRIERKIENLKKNWEGSTGFEMDHWVNQDNFNVGAKAKKGLFAQNFCRSILSWVLCTTHEHNVIVNR